VTKTAQVELSSGRVCAPLVVGDDAAMKRLEDIVHPLVEAARWKFLQEAEARPGSCILIFISDQDERVSYEQSLIHVYS